MRVLAFVDTHGSKMALQRLEKKAGKANLVICLGDFTIFGNGMKKHFDELHRLGEPLFMIHGNHEDASDVKKLCKQHKYTAFLHRAVRIVGDTMFIGYGGGGFSMVDKEFERFGKFVETIIRQKKPKKTVLLLHGPPYGTRLDRLMDDSYCGNKSYTHFIKKNKIGLVLAGHIHENAGTKEKTKDTFYVNPGPFGQLIEI